MSDTYVYAIGDNLYLNLTNRCSNRCTFCVRDQNARYEGYSLWLNGGEPTVAQVKAAFVKETAGRKINEVVFCGYGEPTCRLDAVKELADYIHGLGLKTRMNTNGHGSLLNGRNIAPELKGRIDLVNVSLNAPDEESYNALCRPQIDGAFAALCAFAKQCKEAGVNALFSVVDCIPPEELKRCRALADETGIPLRVREMIDNTEQ